MKSRILALLFLLTLVAPAAAFAPFTIKDIRLEGLQRTEAGTVFSYLPVKVGDSMNDEKADACIHALFSTGFFRDVNLSRDGNVLVVKVKERPTIAGVEINGVSDSSIYSKKQLRETMKYVGLAQGRIFDRGALQKATQMLKNQYTRLGKYGVQVTSVVTPLSRNRVSVVFNVVEGVITRIREVNIIGAHAYSEQDLLDQLKLGTHDMFSWFSHNDEYSRLKLEADIETLKSYYMDSGYLKFTVDSTRVSISSDKKDIFITYNITEGPKYTISKVSVAGPERILSHAEMRKLISVKPGDVFSRKEVNESNSKIAQRVGDDGYSFANVNILPNIDEKNHTVALTFVLNPGQRVYVRHINISGNTRTRDVVVRREFRQLEGAWFDTGATKRSRDRLNRLGYFTDVSISAPMVEGSTDEVDIDVGLKEKNTGQFSIGAGVSSGVGLILSTSVSMSNFMGTGNSLSAQLNTSPINRIASVSYTNPYYTDDGVSRGFDVFKRNTNTANTNYLTPYTQSTDGAGVRFGIPIADMQYIHLGLSYEHSTITLGSNTNQRFIDYVNTFGATTLSYIGTVGWSRDSRDSALYPTRGTKQSVSLESGLPASHSALRYYKLSVDNQWFYPVSKHVTFMLNNIMGVGNGYGGKPLPFFRNYYGGGPSSVRGYEPATLGPLDTEGLATGGNKMFILSGEVLFPMPGMSHNKSVRMSAFIDSGAVWGPIVQTTLPQALGMHYSAGLAFNWLSPMGPIKISFALPIHEKPGDKTQKFQFTMGSLF